MLQTDFLIIGQGLAGSLLAWELTRRDYRVMVVDSGKPNASTVAAGIINPMTGIRLALPPNVEALLPTARTFYVQLAESFGQPFYHEMPMLRLFCNKMELSFGLKRLHQLNYQAYLELPEKPQPLITEINAPLGYIKQKQTGYLSVAQLLERLKKFLIDRQAYRQDILDYQDIKLSHHITWRDINARRIIFCEGHQASQNPWLNWLPMQPAKGEILTITTEIMLPDAILNYGNWLLPTSHNTARIGATFERDMINNLPTGEGKQALLTNLKSISLRLAQAQAVNHQAGIRPCTADRFPFIGKHPHDDKLMIFNGFGSKGSLQIPWYCQRFADYLQHHTPLPVSCDIQRFHASHFPG